MDQQQPPNNTTLNRTVAGAGWIVSVAAGALTSWTARHFPGLHMDNAQATQIVTFAIGVVAVEAGRLRWLHGASQWERQERYLHSSQVIRDLLVDAQGASQLAPPAVDPVTGLSPVVDATMPSYDSVPPAAVPGALDAVAPDDTYAMVGDQTYVTPDPGALGAPAVPGELVAGSEGDEGDAPAGAGMGDG